MRKDGARLHKKIGIPYLLTSLSFFLIGGIEVLIFRSQLTRANLRLISPELYTPMHIVGLLRMSRRTWTYPAGLGWSGLNTIETVGDFILALGTLVFVYNLSCSLRVGVTAGDNSWEAFTLEWATSSSLPVYNFRTIPTVRSRRPMWGLDHPDDPDWQRGN